MVIDCFVTGIPLKVDKQVIRINLRDWLKNDAILEYNI